MFERTTGDDPFRRNPYGVGTVLDSPLDRGDPEQLHRSRRGHARDPRATRADAWVYPAVGTPDSSLDRLAGYRGPDVFNSSTRFQDQPSLSRLERIQLQRAAGSAGAGSGCGCRPKAPAPWISWSTPRPLTLSRLRLGASPLPVRRPTVVRLSWSAGATPPLPVAADGTVTLPAAVRARAFRLTILQARIRRRDTGARARRRRRSGSARSRSRGWSRSRSPAPARCGLGCGAASIAAGTQIVPLQVSGTVAQLDAGLPLRARSCAGTFTLGSGVQEIRALPSVFSVDLLRLSSPCAGRRAAPAAGGGRVTDPGTVGQSSLTGAKVDLTGPSWVVLGESFDRGWQATCNGRSLGHAAADRRIRKRLAGTGELPPPRVHVRTAGRRSRRATSSPGSRAWR